MGDEICIDSVTVDEEDATLITENKISSGSANIMMAIFKYPVCESEVIDVRVDMDSAKIDMSKASNAGIECKNYNPLISTECNVAISRETSTTQSFSFERSDGYSWGSSSSFTYGSSTTQSITTSDEFSWGMGQSLTIGTEKEIGVDGGIVSAKASLSTEIGFSANQQWTSSREETNEKTHSEEQTQEQSQESVSS